MVRTSLNERPGGGRLLVCELVLDEVETEGALIVLVLDDELVDPLDVRLVVVLVLLL